MGWLGPPPRRGLHFPAGTARGRAAVDLVRVPRRPLPSVAGWGGGVCGRRKMAARRGGLLCLPLALALLAGGSSARGAGPLPVASSEAFDSVLGNTASCHRACQLTYSLHTYPKVRAGPASRLSRRGGPLPGLGPAPLLPPSPPREPCCGWRGRPRAWPSALSPLQPLVVSFGFLCCGVTGHRRDFLGQEPFSRRVAVRVFSSGVGRVFKQI